LDDTQKPGSHPNRVRELREDRLMTQAQLARKARVALRTIHSVEKGMNCRMDTKRKILLALGMRFEDKDQVFPPSRRGYAHSAGLAALEAFSASARPGSEDNLS
jgi:DNA-binding XRE family transcriptional regulator